MRLSEVDLNALLCMSFVCWNNSGKYLGARLWDILYIMMAFWYLILSGNFIHLSSANISFEGESKSLSSMHLAALFWNLTIEYSSSELALPHIVQQ